MQKMNLQNIRPFIRQAIITKLDTSRYTSQRLKTRDCRLFYIFSGTGKIVFEKSRYDIQSGMAILFQTGTEYEWQTEDLRYLSVNFDYTSENRNIRKTFSPVKAALFPADNFSKPLCFENALVLNQPLVVYNANSFENRLRSIATEYHIKGEFCDELLSSLLKSVIIGLVRIQNERSSTVHQPKKAVKVREIIEYIQFHFDKDINNKKIAAHFHFNESYINRIFKESVGVTLHTFLIDYRMELAKDLLRGQELSVAAVADAVGFRDAVHFNKMFKAKFGVTPGKFRNAQ